MARQLDRARSTSATERQIRDLQAAMFELLRAQQRLSDTIDEVNADLQRLVDQVGGGVPAMDLQRLRQAVERLEAIVRP